MMSFITITRRLEFDAGHRVVNHESKCATLHGHRYVVEIVATAPNLDGIGRVIDFSVLKQKIGKWLDDNWDHTCVLYKEDTETIQALFKLPRAKDPFVTDWNPTAENMAAFLLREVCPRELEGTGVTVTEVIVWETPNCRATAKL
jgi:6-pyruvoyltetrahydropterin/6-carboxytetrahydropterin synthase